jgi:hypothetical protein
MADDDLAARVAALEEQLTTLRQRLAETELDDWKARIDHLEVQLHLGEMGARDQIGPLVEQLRNRWLDARTQLDRVGDAAGGAVSNVSGAAGGAVSSVGDSVRGALYDLRRVLADAADRLTGR